MKQMYELLLALAPALGIVLGIIIFLRGVIAAAFVLLWDIIIMLVQRSQH